MLFQSSPLVTFAKACNSWKSASTFIWSSQLHHEVRRAEITRKRKQEIKGPAQCRPAHKQQELILQVWGPGIFLLNHMMLIPLSKSSLLIFWKLFYNSPVASITLILVSLNLNVFLWARVCKKALKMCSVTGYIYPGWQLRVWFCVCVCFSLFLLDCFAKSKFWSADRVWNSSTCKQSTHHLPRS